MISESECDKKKPFATPGMLAIQNIRVTLLATYGNQLGW